jgi:hypothetical protein
MLKAKSKSNDKTNHLSRNLRRVAAIPGQLFQSSQIPRFCSVYLLEATGLI